MAASTVAYARAAREELLAAGLEAGELHSLMGFTWAYSTPPDGGEHMILSGSID